MIVFASLVWLSIKLHAVDRWTGPIASAFFCVLMNDINRSEQKKTMNDQNNFLFHNLKQNT